MKARLFFMLIAVAIFGYPLFLTTSRSSQDSSGFISGEKARELAGNGGLLLDVRTVREYESGHIPGAVNIPVHLIEANLDRLTDKERVIVVYCKSGGRSTRAKNLLNRLGYTKVYNLGGVGNW